MNKILVPLLASSALLVSACGDNSAPVADPRESQPATGQTVEPAPVPAPAPQTTPQPADEVAPVASDRALRPTGYGAQRVGAAPLTTGPDAIAEDGLQISDSCRILRGKGLPGVYAMTDGKTIGRISLDQDSKVTTDRGIGVGATEAAVRKAYTPLREQGHKYVPAPGKNLYWEPNGAEGPALRFEIGQDGRVTDIHAGIPPILHYVEGCA